MNDLYGRKIGLLKLVLANILDHFGVFSMYKNIRWEKGRRLVFICQGNICRSAYAEARATQFMMPSASAGIKAIENGSANPDAIRFAARRSIDLSRHRTTSLSMFKQRDGDIFVCMEPSQALLIRKMVGKDNAQQVTLLGLWSDNRRPYLQDPYGLSEGYWNTCLNIIDSAIVNISHYFKCTQNEECIE